MAFSNLITRLGVLLATVSLFAATLSDAAVPSAFTPVPEGKLTRLQFDIKSRASPVAINRVALAKLRVRDEMEFVLPNAARYMVVFDRIEDHGGGIRSSVGYLKGHSKDFRVIITAGPSGTFGTITTPETTYRIIPGDGHDWMVDETEERKLIPPIDLGDDIRRPPVAPSIGKVRNAVLAIEQSAQAGPGQDIALAVTPTPQATIDLMIVYTNGLATRLGANLMTRLNNLVASANTAYSDSEVAITLRLVNATMVNYPDNTDDSGALDAITPVGGPFNAAVFGNIETIRSSVGADLVSFLRSGSDNGGSGIAWLSSINPNSQYLYSTLNGCVVGCNSVFIHELGHNMGNAHDRATAAYQTNNPNPTGGAYAYSFGHYYCASGSLTCNPFVVGGCATQPRCSTTGTNTGNVGTIMSYFNPVTLKFSNPSLQCAPADGGSPAQPCGVPNQEDNARSMNNMRTTLAGIKPTMVGASLQFSQNIFTASESSGIATVTVSRTGDSNGAVSVNYATSAGTAKPGFDYVEKTGTLNWADGDTADKSFTVTLIDDGVAENGESFNVTLSSPAGPGTILGSPAAAVVTISELWPPGCTMPGSGWTSAPAGATTGWSIATDSFSSATCSLKSNPMANTGVAGVFNKAQIQFTGTFVAGNVVFSRRVSSENHFDCLRFIIDTAQQFIGGDCGGNGGTGASGEIAWGSVSIPIAAGPHTLTWSYEKDNILIGGSDAAWIDDVSLPLQLNAVSGMSLVSSSNPSSLGQSVTFTATVSGPVGTPAGVVTFRDGASIISGCNLVAMNGGTAQCTTSALAIGTHSITAAYSGNTVYDVSTSTPLTQTVNVGGTVPGAPTIGAVTPGNGLATVNFTPPASDGGQPITSYNATCSPAGAVSGMSSPIVVTGLTNGTQYSCSVTATNVIGAGAASAAVSVTPRTVPGAPTIISATPGNTQATIAFSVPSTDGGAAITGYTASCVNAGTVTGSGMNSPIVVSPLNNGVAYNCSVAATNVAGTGSSSGTLAVTPAALALISAASRKNHPGFGNCDVPIAIGIPVGGQISVEPRTVAGGHALALNFNATITSVSTVSASIGSATIAGFPGTTLTATLTGIADNQRVSLTLNGLNGSAASASLALGFLVGDISGSRAVNAADIAAVRAQNGLVLNPGNCRMDLNVTGGVSSTDISAAKARSGTVLP